MWLRSGEKNHSSAINHSAIKGGSVNLRTGELSLSIKPPQLSGFLAAYIVPAIRYNQSLLNSGNQFLGLPMGCTFPFSYISKGFIHVNGEKSFALATAYETGMRYYTLKTAKFKYVDEKFIYDKSQQCANILFMYTGEKQYFDIQGRLIGIDDRFGNHVLFYYTSKGTVFNTKLAKIKDSYGQEIKFIYNKDSIDISYPKNNHTVVKFSYLMCPDTLQLLGYIDPLGNKTSILHKGGKVRRDLISEVKYPNGHRIIYEYEKIKYKTSNNDSKFLDVVSVIKEGYLNQSREINYDYNPLDNYHNYTGYPLYGLTDHDGLLESKGNYQYVTKVDNGLFVTKHFFNHLHLEILKETYTKDDKLIESVANYYPAQDEEGYFPQYQNLINNYPNYQLPKKVVSKVYNDDGKERCTIIEATLDDYGNAISSRHYKSTTDGNNDLILSFSSETTYDYSDLRYRNNRNLYGLVTKKFETDHLEKNNNKSLTRATINSLTEDGKSIATSTKGFSDTIKDTQMSTPNKTTEYRYDSRGREIYKKLEWVCKSTHELVESEACTSYNKSNNILIITTTDAQGNESKQEIDTTTGWLIRKSNALGHVTTYTYDNIGRQTSFTDPLDIITRWEYSDLENKITTQYANGYMIHNYSNVYGKTIRTTDNFSPSGAERVLYTCNYNNLNQLIWEQGVLGDKSRINYSYNTRGQRVGKIDARGNESTQHYDEVNLIKKIRVNNIQFVKEQYDYQGNITEFSEVSSNDGIVDNYCEYNNYHKIIKATIQKQSDDNYCIQSEFKYDLELKPLEKRALFSSGAQSRFVNEYDLFGNVVHTQHTINTTQNDKQTISSDRIHYNNRNLLTSITNNLSQSDNLYYDAIGNLVSYRDYRGTNFSFLYNRDGTVQSKVFTDEKGNTHETRIKYYVDTKKIRSIEKFINEESNGKLEYEYDLIGNILSLKYPDDRMVNYSYDNNGFITTIHDVEGRCNSYQYNGYGEIVKTNRDEKNSVEFSYYTKEEDSYNAQKIKSKLYDNGLLEIFEYYKDGTLKNQSVRDTSKSKGCTIISETKYHYDLISKNITELNRISNKYPLDENLNNITKYQYDDFNRLSNEIITTLSGKFLKENHYQYDAANNIIYHKKTLQDSSFKERFYKYDLDNKLQSYCDELGVVEYEYDVNGNLIKDTNGKTYLYDLENNLIGFKDGKFKTKAKYTYYPNGLRRSKQVNNSEEITFYYDAKDVPNIINEIQGNNHSSYLMIGNQRLLRVLSNKDKEETEYIIQNYKDGIANIDDYKTLIKSFNYTPYGNSTNQKELIGSIINNPFRYNMEYLDDESQLIYLRSRYYYPEISRFITRDKAITLNRYAYSNGNPITYIDPMGFMCEAAYPIKNAKSFIDLMMEAAGKAEIAEIAGASVSLDFAFAAAIAVAVAEVVIAAVIIEVVVGAVSGTSTGKQPDRQSSSTVTKNITPTDIGYKPLNISGDDPNDPRKQIELPKGGCNNPDLKYSERSITESLKKTLLPFVILGVGVAYRGGINSIISRLPDSAIASNIMNFTDRMILSSPINPFPDLVSFRNFNRLWGPSINPLTYNQGYVRFYFMYTPLVFLYNFMVDYTGAPDVLNPSSVLEKFKNDDDGSCGNQ